MKLGYHSRSVLIVGAIVFIPAAALALFDAWQALATAKENVSILAAARTDEASANFDAQLLQFKAVSETIGHAFELSGENEAGKENGRNSAKRLLRATLQANPGLVGGWMILGPKSTAACRIVYYLL